MVTDLGTNVLETVLPGGPGGNILSNFYGREIDMFLEDRYKRIELWIIVGDKDEKVDDWVKCDS